MEVFVIDHSSKIGTVLRSKMGIAEDGRKGVKQDHMSTENTRTTGTLCMLCETAHCRDVIPMAAHPHRCVVN